MGFRNREHLRMYMSRKSERYARVGRELELEVEHILAEMVERGLLITFIHHAPHSAEDTEGKDFSMQKFVEGMMISRSFGITISQKSWQRAMLQHPKTPQFCFPIGIKRETMQKRIHELFDK